MAALHFGPERDESSKALGLRRIRSEELRSSQAGDATENESVHLKADDKTVVDTHSYRPHKRMSPRRVALATVIGWAVVSALVSLLWLTRDRGGSNARHSAPAIARDRPPLPSPTLLRADDRQHSEHRHPVAEDTPNELSGQRTLSESASEAGDPFTSAQPAFVQNEIDALVFKRLDEIGIAPAKLCSDEAFLRRIYIDTLGTLPTVDEARQFLDDPDPEKRTKLIDRLLERPEFADYWAMKWCDILRVKAEFPIKLWPHAAQAYHRWIRTSIKDNLPYDLFVTELLTSSGSNFRTPQVNFYRAVQSKEPKALAQAVALTFLCERAEKWPAERLEGMSVFFSQVGYKPTGEWKEEIVLFDPRLGKAEHGDNPLTAVFPNGDSVQIPPGQDPRQVFAAWLGRRKESVVVARDRQPRLVLAPRSGDRQSSR